MRGPSITSSRSVRAGAITAVLFLVACGRSGGVAGQASSSPPAPSTGSPVPGSPSQPAGPSESPVPVENNPPGDIPDNTVYVPFRSTKGRYSVKVPEGWSRQPGGSSVAFTDKLNTVTASWFAATAAPTPGSAKSKDVPALASSERAFSLGRIIYCAPSCTIPYSTGPIAVTLPAGRAVVITYESNSAPNAVTGKQYRLEDLRFEFYRNGREVALTLSGPVGSDNVDPWRLVSESFRWL